VTRIAIVNCNTTEAMTRVIAARAGAAVRPDTEIVAITPRWGVESAEGWYDSFISAAAVLYELERLPDGIDGVVLAGFGEHGREGARELLDIPVIDITEAAAHLAMPLGRRFAIVTPLARSVSQIEDSLMTAGLLGRCAAIEDTGLGVLETDPGSERTRDAFVAAARRAIDKGAEVICLGCAGMAGLEKHLRDRIPVPVVDGVAAAAALAETIVRNGLTTSKNGSYSRPLPKTRTWNPPGTPAGTPAAGPAAQVIRRGWHPSPGARRSG
jgi:allantoin racemase